MEPTTTAPIQPAPTPARRGNFELLELIMQAGEQDGKAYAKEILDVEVQRSQLNQDHNLATVFYDSGIFSDLKGKTPEQGIATAIAKIQIGRAWQMNAGDAMQFIYFDRNGKPQVQNEYIAARLKRAGWDWKIQWLQDGDRATGCVLWPRFDGKVLTDHEDKPVSVSFTEKEAERAGLLTKDGAWKTYARDMYYWKAIARLKRQHATDVLTGASLEGEDYGADALAPVEEMPRQGSKEAQAEVLAKKLQAAAEWNAKRNGQPAPPAQVTTADSNQTKPDAAGEFFA